ncbi:MAG: putative dehydrogenase/Predicted dehydrogenase [Verrucomicrobia bacterium]|nr:MAG: putative dehydrogenase/Predicted dehydrogenase [Verrucomicrobiota bacterium]
MNPDSPTPTTGPNRRHFLRQGATLGAALTVGSSLSRSALASTNKNSKLRIFQIGVGGIGALQRDNLTDHPMVEWAGFCDVDKYARDRMEVKFPGTFLTADYREAFAKHADKFDAVIVDTPDFHHAPMMITALKHKKHVYGQKPLVHQLDELRLMKEALAARPGLFTQMGNQRACLPGRMQAVELLKSNRLGKPVEAHVWTGTVALNTYFVEPWSALPDSMPVPPTLDWDLWNGPLAQPMPFHPERMFPRRWRAYWETGGGQLADWGCHLLDVLYFAYDLPSPVAVQTNTMQAANTGHSAYNQCTLTYPGGGKFARPTFVVHYNDSLIRPSFAALGLPPSAITSNATLIVCEEGSLVLEANGKMEIYRKGQLVADEPMPEVAPRNHWKDWADCCLGDVKPLWTQFDIGVRITEPALLAVKASRFPGQELLWDGKAYRFTNHEEANATLLSRTYREGFAPPSLAQVG